MHYIAGNDDILAQSVHSDEEIRSTITPDIEEPTPEQWFPLINNNKSHSTLLPHICVEIFPHGSTRIMIRLLPLLSQGRSFYRNICLRRNKKRFHFLPSLDLGTKEVFLECMLPLRLLVLVWDEFLRHCALQRAHEYSRRDSSRSRILLRRSQEYSREWAKAQALYPTKYRPGMRPKGV